MRTVNALVIRNRLGEVLDELERTREPILVSRGRRIRAALVAIEDFQARFLDRQAEEERERFLRGVEEARARRVGTRDSLDVLRELRGYDA